MCQRTLLRAPAVVAIGCAAAVNTVSNADWIRFVDQTDQRLITDASFGTEDFEERDYAWADLNNNGWVDLVAMRKQIGTSPGLRTNRLFMNEQGVLVDRTAEYASAVDLDQLPEGATDEGFLTPTNDRDSVIADLNNNGWMDIVTAPAVSNGQPKHIGYPRVYMNQGDDGRGQWQGFIFENDRIPLIEPLPHMPRFAAVDAGDLTGNGYADLYFGDHDGGLGGGGAPMTLDFNDRILINDGNAFFQDESQNMVAKPLWLQSAFTSGVRIADLNVNGSNDVVRVDLMSGPAFLLYNTGGPDEAPLDQLVSFSGVHEYVEVADLNNTSRPDLIFSRNGSDIVHLNMETNDLGQVSWNSVTLPGSNGFRSNIVTADLNRNGWTDILIADMDNDLINCNNGANIADIFRNLGGTEESISFENNPGNIGGAANMRNTFDFAVFDLTGNGWPDIVQARCSNAGPGKGTTVWINRTFELCPADVNQDGQINVFDLLDLLEDWGPCPDCPTDLTGSGTVDVFDLLELLENWGSCT